MVSRSLEMYNGPVDCGSESHRQMCRSGVYVAARLGFPELKCSYTYEELGGAPLSEYTYALQLAIAGKQKHAIEHLLDAGTPASHQLPFGFAPILIATNLDVGSDSEIYSGFTDFCRCQHEFRQRGWYYIALFIS
jgi:hypothetical protein